MTFFQRRAREDDEKPTEPASDDASTLLEKKESPPRMANQSIGFSTVLGPQSEMKGVLHCEANARLDGSFSGEMQIGGNVLVGETARIEADIHARNVSVAGAVRGNICGRKVQLLRTSRVWGDIEATALTTEEGAFIDGRITMVSQETHPESQTREADSDEAKMEDTSTNETPEGGTNAPAPPPSEAQGAPD